MLDYKSIIVRRYALHMSGVAIAEELGCSKSGVNDFLKQFEECDKLSYPLPEGITNYGIAELVYGRVNGQRLGRNEGYVLPDYQEVHHQLISRKNMTLVYQWSQYKKRCEEDSLVFYSYRQFCQLYETWCKNNEETAHFNHIPGQIMEVDFAGKTFKLRDPLSGEESDIIVFVAVLPYSQLIYAEGMASAKEPQWISVNNNALSYFGGVPSIVVCDNCKQAVIVNDDWIHPTLNKDYAEWADHNKTAIIPAKVKKPKYKSSVENAVGILEKGVFLDLDELPFFSLEQFNRTLWEKLDKLNDAKLKNREYSRRYYWAEEKLELLSLPPHPYEYTERKEATVSSDFHIRFDNAYYSVDKSYKHQKVSIRATSSTVKIYARTGKFICEHPRAIRKGQWLTNPDHLPKDYSGFTEWNADYFIKKATAIGPNTVHVIKTILKSKEQEVQTYRLCLGVIRFSKTYSHEVLEECCRQALDINRANYSYIKNTIASVAEDAGQTPADKTRRNEEKNKGGYVMSSEVMDVEHLLKKSTLLVKKADKEVRTHE